MHQCGQFMYFGLVGSHYQLYTVHTLVNLLVMLFYILARHRMIEAARRDKNGMLQSVPWHDVSLARKSKPSIQTQPEASKSVPEDSFAGWNLRSFQPLAKHILSVRPIFLRLREASRTVREVVFRTGFSISFLTSDDIRHSTSVSISYLSAGSIIHLTSISNSNILFHVCKHRLTDFTSAAYSAKHWLHLYFTLQPRFRSCDPRCDLAH